MLNSPIYIDGMLGMGDTIYQRAFVKQLPAGTFIKTAWPELYEDLPVKAVRSDTTLRTQRKNEFRSSAKFYLPPSPRQTKRIFYGPDDLRRGSIFDAMRRQFGVTPAALDLPSFGPAQFTHQKPIAVIRPATVRSEWRSDSRNPDPDYLLRASRILRQHFCVISVADLQDGEEWLVGEEAPMTPLRLETIGEGKFKGILPLDRWMINPVLTRRIKEMGPDLGKPEFYDVVTTATGIPAWRIHHSRLIRFDGVTLPFQQKMTENEWGMSVVERIWDRLTAFDSATVGAAQLVYKAHLRTYSVEKLRELIALGGPAFEALLKNIDLIRQFQSNEGMTLMDSRDKFETHQYSFSGLDDILSQFAEQISGAVGIPLVRLFGQSPKGFSTGDADLANYYDRVSSLQERRLRLPMRRILDIMHRSELGKPLPDDFTFEFNPLWQMSDVDRSTVAVNTTNAISTALGDGLMTRKAAMTDLRENSDVTGIGASITDEDIENAEDEAPPGIGELGDKPPESPGGDPISNEPTADSAGGRGYRKWALRWFKR